MKDYMENIEEQSDQDKKLVRSVHDKFVKSDNAKRPYVNRWKKSMESYEGEYFKQQLPSYKSDLVVNYIYSTIETIRPIMTAENPKFTVMPRYQEDFSKSCRVQNAIDYEWQRTKMDMTIPEIMLPTLVMGTAFIALLWDGKDKGAGNVKPTYVSCMNAFPDPQATNMENAEYFIYATYKSLGEMIKRFPDKAELLKKEARQPDNSELVYGQDTGTMSNNRLLVLECYSTDYSTVEEEGEDNEGNKVKKRKLQYPNGRRTLVAGDVLLEDGENPYDHGKFPFVMFKCYSSPDKFWGSGEAEQLISPQKSINDLENQIIENAKLTANCQWIIDKNANIPTGSLTNRPGLIVRKTPGAEVRREQPPSMPMYVQQTVDVLKRDIEIISGVHDVTRGERPASVTSGVAIQQLTQSAQSRTKLKVKLLETSLQELGSMWVQLIRQFWKLPRQIRVMYTPQKYEQYVKQQMETQGVPQEEVDLQGTVMPKQNGMIPIFSELSGDEIDGDWDIFVVSGSTMPVNKNARLQMLIQLAQTPAEDGMPMINRKAVLENSELPNIDEILEYFDNKGQENAEQQQAQMEQQQAQIDQQQQSKQAMEQEKVSAKRETEQEKIGAKREESEKKHQLDVVKLLTELSDKEKEGGEGATDIIEPKDTAYNVSETPQENPMEQVLANMENMSDEEILQLIQENPELLEQLLEYLGVGMEEFQQLISQQPTEQEMPMEQPPMEEEMPIM